MASSSSNPYQSFAKLLTSYQSQYGEAGPSTQLDTPIRHDAVLDEQGGLINSLMATLEETLRSKGVTTTFESSEDEITQEEREALGLEHRTWQLVRAVYSNRLHRGDSEFQAPSSKSLLEKNPYVSPEELVQSMVNEDDELSLWATLVDQLQSRPISTSPPPLEARHGYLPSTLRRAKASQLNSTASRPLTPPSLDPDFTIRDPHGQGLAGEDQTYQTPLLETLFDLVRHGELDRAIKVCEQGGEPWRGASLMGGRRWSMGGMDRDSIGVLPLEGNRTRALWKKACRAIARNATLSQAERSLYAALTTDLPSLLPACDTWGDHLWAHVQSRVEARLEDRWHKLGSFWEAEDRLLGRDELDDGIEGGLKEVFASIEHVQKEGVLNASRNPYYVAQKMIILGRTDDLLNQFAGRLEGIEEDVSPALIGPLIRFFSHLVLLLRTLNQPVPESAANAILQAYLQILERGGSDQLVAMYAACLREGSGEQSYAKFLRAMDPEATREARYEALLRAKQHNLDVALIARETVRIILQEAFSTAPALTTRQPDITSFATRLTERDVYLIRSVQWLTMLPETMSEALVKSNDVCRYFLALGQANAAESLLKTLPTEIIDASNEGEDNEQQEHEHDHYQHLFGVFASFELVEEVLSRAPKSTATKVEQHNWRKSLGMAIDKTHTASLELLTGDWLRFPEHDSSENDSPRHNELNAIRQIFIPDLVMRLHTLLMSQRQLFPHLLQQALDLSTIVAAEKYHVYEDFFGWDEGNPYRLIAYLERVREAGLASLQSGSGSAFVVKV